MRLPRLFRNRWKDAMLDAAVNTWCLTVENRDDPQRLLRDIIATNIEWERDPRITENPLPPVLTYPTKGIPEPSPPPPPPKR